MAFTQVKGHAELTALVLEIRPLVLRTHITMVDNLCRL